MQLSNENEPQNVTEAQKKFEEFRFLTFSCTFCQLSNKLPGVEVEHVQQATNSLSKRLI